MIGRNIHELQCKNPDNITMEVNGDEKYLNSSSTCGPSQTVFQAFIFHIVRPASWGDEYRRMATKIVAWGEECLHYCAVE